jgi:hypothetical protein
MVLSIGNNPNLETWIGSEEMTQINSLKEAWLNKADHQPIVNKIKRKPRKGSIGPDPDPPKVASDQALVQTSQKTDDAIPIPINEDRHQSTEAASKLVQLYGRGEINRLTITLMPDGSLIFEGES